MPLHLLGKKSWNVYNPANIERVKADEAAAAAREAADEQRMQEIDAERRAAILRGQTPPPLPEEDTRRDERGSRRSETGRDGHDRKRRRLAGEDDTDRDIRLARTVTDPKEEDDLAVLKLRRPKSDAPLTDHAGNINLFPVNLKEAVKRERNAEAEKEKKKKELALEDQYTMRLSNAAGKGVSKQPWYATADTKSIGDGDGTVAFSDLADKDVWGNKDPRRREREQARMTSSDPLAFMNKAQVQLKKSQKDRKQWAELRARELMELRAAQERDERRYRHNKRKKRADDDLEGVSLDAPQDRYQYSRHRHRHRSRSRSRERPNEQKSSHRHGRRRSRTPSRSRSRERDRRHEHRASQRQEQEGRSTRLRGRNGGSRPASGKYD